MAHHSRAKKPRAIETELTEEQINSAVRGVLMLDQSKKIIKQSDVIHFISDPPSRKLYPKLWTEVQSRLEEIGFTLLLNRQGQKTMFLISAEQEQDFMLKHARKEEKADRTLLVLILSYIFMKEEAISEDDIFKYLKKLNIITEDTFIHPYFGDVKKKVQNQFVEEMYIKRSVTPESTHELDWGPRAEVELSMMGVLQFVCKVGYNDQHKPEKFHTQFEKAQAQDGGVEEAGDGEVSQNE